MLAILAALLLALLAFIVVAGFGAWTSVTNVGSVTSLPASEVSVVEAVSPGAAPWLVDPGWLQTNLDDPNLRIVALMPEQDFAAGHIPGAVQIDYPQLDLADTSSDTLAAWEEAMDELLTTLGISRETTVVVYDNGTHYAPRFWWVLAERAHPQPVGVLDGGLAAWQGVGGKLVTTTDAVTMTAPYHGSRNTAILASKDEAASLLHNPSVVIVDARTPGEYAAGHIPGAINVPFLANYATGAAGGLLDADSLTELYIAAGITPEKQIIVYCSTGVRASSDVFALLWLGYPNVRNYTGGWNEWSSDSSLPVEQ